MRTKCILMLMMACLLVCDSVNAATLVGEWNFETICDDDSGYGNDGSFYDDAPFYDVAGHDGYALDPNGSCVVIPDDSSLDATVDLHIDVWVKPSGTGSGKVVHKGATGGTYYMWELIMESGKPRLSVNRVGNQRANAKAAAVLTQGVWYHIEGTYDGTDIKVWQDGYVVATTNHPGTLMTNDWNIGIGGKAHDGNENFAGLIDEVKISISFAPSITTQPISRSVDLGDPVTFIVAGDYMSGGSYQWRKGGEDITDGGKFSGATTDTLSITNVQADEFDSYDCVLTNAITSVTSNAALLAEKALVAHYEFADTTDSALDNNLTLAGDATVGDSGGVANLDGYVMTLDGDGDYGTLTAAADGIPTAGLPYTLEFWANIDSSEQETGNYFRFYGYGDTSPANNYSELVISTENPILGSLVYPSVSSMGNLFYWCHDPDTADIVGNWVHFASTYDQTDMKLYINGSLRATGTPSAMYDIVSADNLRIGGSSYHPATTGLSRDFHGLLDDVKIYNYARTAAQIVQAVADDTGQPACTGPIDSDIDGDCDVDLADFAEMAGEWLDDNLVDPTP